MSGRFFSLSESRRWKAAPDLIADDEAHFELVEESLRRSIAALAEQLDVVRAAPAGAGQKALDRDQEVRRLSARLRVLRRFDLDVCLGRTVPSAGGEPLYIGRIGLADDHGRRLLVDWRTPAAEPFFAATLADPKGLASRRRYRWNRGRVADYWDEVLDLEHPPDGVALDDDSALIASLGSSRSARMRDVLTTIQADQDAIIRAGSRGPLVVDGGPGTGKTVVALHRAAYLLYADPRLDRGGSSILFVGPHEPYLAYVADVLPDLGEEGVHTCTLRELVPEGAEAAVEDDPEVARLKGSGALLAAVDRAVDGYEQPPTEELTLETPWGEVELTRADWAEAFTAADPGTPHDDARDEVWEALLEILGDRFDEDVPPTVVRRYLQQEDDLASAFRRAWPVLDPAGVVADLWAVPDFLQRCAPWLTPDEAGALHRRDARGWTVADLPYLDAARRRIGDPRAGARRRRRAATLAAEREARERIAEELIAADDSELLLMSILRGQDAKNSLVDETALPTLDPDTLAGPYPHVVVDEAQELTDTEWRMLLDRCPSRSFTVVGDRAQSRRGFPESWGERLERVGLGPARIATLSVNYRTPEEVMAEAEPVIRAALPDANVPLSVRSNGIPVRRAPVAELGALVEGWLDDHAEGTVCVIGEPAFPGTERVRSLSPLQVKGLEFDLVVLVEPAAFGDGVQGAVDRYVAMTRTTQQLVVLEKEAAGATS